MSRPLRIEYPDAWYHVMNRGRGGEAIFTTDGDRSIFVDLLNRIDEGELLKVRRGMSNKDDPIFFVCRWNVMEEEN